MLKLIHASLWLCLVIPQAFAADSKPSEESIRELFKVSNTQQLIDSTIEQADAVMKSSMQKALQGKSISADQQKIIDTMQSKVVALFRQEFNWDKLEPAYIRIYQNSFTQAEIDGILNFYKTPAGKALIDKMPAVLQNSIAEMQNQMGPLIQKIQKIQQESLEELKASR